MPRGKGKCRESQQETQRDKIKTQNVKKRKREENKQFDKQAKRRRVDWLRDIRSILRSSGQKLEFPKHFSERKLNKIQREKKCLRNNTISDKDEPGTSGRSRDNFVNTMIEFENKFSSDLDDDIESLSSGSSKVDINEASVINEDHELKATRSRNQIDKDQDNIQTNNLKGQEPVDIQIHYRKDQYQENSQSGNLIDQSQENIQNSDLMDQFQENHIHNDQPQINYQFDNFYSTSNSFINSNGCLSTIKCKALVEIRRDPSKETDNATIIESERSTNISKNNSFIILSNDFNVESNSDKYVSSADRNCERSNNEMESGEHNMPEKSLNDSRNYWNFNSNIDSNDGIFYFGSTMHEKKKGTNIANYSFASHSNNLSDNQDLLQDGDSGSTVNDDEMEVNENNTIHIQEGENNDNSNELNRNTMQINDLPKCLFHPTDTLVYNNNNQNNSADENTNSIKNFHRNSFAYYDHSRGAFVNSSSLQNNSSTSQSLKNTWGSIKNLLSRVSGQKSNENQLMKEGDDSEGLS